MIKDINPVEDYLKAVTGKFDLDTIFYLNLPKKSIIRLSSICDCKSLILLDLQKNKLTSITGISRLKSLNFLDLSFNSISNIDELELLTNLRHLKLHGNNISNFPSGMSNLKKLEKLTFQILPYKEDKSVNTSNPLCKNDNYRQDILDQLPNLHMLDCIARDIEPFNADEEDDNQELLDKLDPKNYEFDFGKEIEFNVNDIINEKDVENAQKLINEKYSEFEKEMEDLKKVLDDIN